MTVRWNDDKPHRCPSCHTIVINEARPSRWRRYECCRCAVRFTRFSWLSAVLPLTKCDSDEHEDACPHCGGWGILIPSASDELYERALAALQNAGISKFEAHLQTWEQHAEHPLRSSLLETTPDAPKGGED
jgi:hypothetical protein